MNKAYAVAAYSPPVESRFMYVYMVLESLEEAEQLAAELNSVAALLRLRIRYQVDATHYKESQVCINGTDCENN